MASRESWRRLCRKLERCDWPKPVCRASSDTLTVPRCILRSSSSRSLSCICVKFICGNSATSNGSAWSLFAPGKSVLVSWPQLWAHGGRPGIALSEKLQGRLTQGNQLPRLDLLNLELACGNLLRNDSMPQ